MYSILIVDDFRMSRTVFEHAVAMEDDYVLVGSFTTADEAVRFFREGNRADLVVMDVVMAKGQSGLEAAAAIKAISFETKILMVTSTAEASFMKRARKAFVESFWYKEVQEQPILEIIRLTLAGESVYPDHAPVVAIGSTVSTEFSDRELDVLRYLVNGDSNKEIGDKLAISERTVKAHISSMLEKTGFRSRLELAVKARSGGLVVGI